MTDRNFEAIGLFPKPEEMADSYTRQDALKALWRTVEATRAAVDEISVHTTSLTTEELMYLGTLAEQLNAKAAEFHAMIDK